MNKYLIILALTSVFSSSYVVADEDTISEAELIKLRIKELELKKQVLELEQKSQANNSNLSSTPTYLKENREIERPRNSGYIRGPRGGCYTIGSTGRKNYVARSMCD